MKQLWGFAWLQALARWCLDERDWVRVIGPALADAWFERSHWDSEWRWRWYTRYRLATTIVVASLVAALDRMRRAQAAAIVASAFAGLCGYQHMHATQFAGANNHIAFVLLGVVAAGYVIAAPSRMLRALAWCIGFALVTALLACSTHGTAFEGRRQWLSLGGLNIHVSTLFLPFFAVVVSALRRCHRIVSLGVVASSCLVSLAMQPDWQAFAVYTAVLLVTHVGAQARSMRWLLGAGCLLPLPMLVAGNVHNEPWVAFGAVGLVTALLGVLVGAPQQTPWSPTRTALLTAMVTMTALRSCLGDTLPIIGFGGSATVVFFVVIAACIRMDAHTHDRASLSQS